MKKNNFILLLVCSITIFAQAQLQKPFIEVTGISEMEIVPNEIYLNICIEERNEKGKTVEFEKIKIVPPKISVFFKTNSP